jgi:hypothetical protein
MIIVRIFEYVVSGLLILGFITEIVVPLWKGTPYFPSFRKRHKLQNQLIQTREEVSEIEVEQRISKEKTKADGKRRKSEETSDGSHSSAK